MRKHTVWCPELGGSADFGREIMALDHEDAACIWAQREDAESAEYWIVGGDGTTVMVCGPDGAEQAVRVTGEPSIDYRARVVKA